MLNAKTLIVSSVLLCGSAFAGDVDGENLTLQGSVLQFPDDPSGGIAPYSRSAVAQPNPDGTRNLTWIWGYNRNLLNGSRYDAEAPGFFDSLEMNWRPPGNYAGERWMEYYRSLIAPDGGLGFRWESMSLKHADGSQVERVFRSDVIDFAGPPSNSGYVNESAIRMLLGRGANSGAFMYLSGFLLTQGNAANRGGVGLRDGGVLSLYSIGNTNSFNMSLASSVRSGWSGKPTVRFNTIGDRSLEILGITNIYSDTKNFELTGKITPAGGVCLPTNAPPIDPVHVAAWIPIQGTNGQTYLIPAYK